MPRNGSGVASAVPGFGSYTASTTILSALMNAGLVDVINMLNSPWPLSVGLGAAGQIGSWDAITAKGTDIASASTIVLTTATGPRIDITGTVAITAVTLANGSMRIARATGIFVLTASATLIVNKSTSVNYTTAVGDLMIFTAEGGVTSVTVIGSSSASSATTSNASVINFAIGTPSVAASALTIPFNGIDGNAFSASNTGYVNFRSATAGSGAIAQLALIAAMSLVISSGSTLGMTSGVAATLALAIFNDAGTARPAIINPLVLPLVDGIASATSEGGAGAADSAGVWYSNAAITSKAYTIVGYITVTEATAGTWATAPSLVQVGPVYAVNNALPLVTSWVAWTPTFTGFGTVTAIFMESRRVGDSLEVRGKFTSGTTTAVEARMSIGFNGVDGNVMSSSTKVPSIQLTGYNTLSTANNIAPTMLIEQSVSYMTFGAQFGAGSGGLGKLLANGFTSSGVTESLFASIPIQGW